jgi:hypothetical protein
MIAVLMVWDWTGQRKWNKATRFDGSTVISPVQFL